MSLAIRIIPCLDVDAGRVVKGINFINLVDAGYDKTFAELTIEEKSKISHRGLAVQQLVAFLK